MPYEIEIEEESGRWSYVGESDKAAEAEKRRAKYQEKSGMTARVRNLNSMLTRQDFIKDKQKGVWVSRDGHYRLTNFGIATNGGWDKWWMERRENGQWKRTHKGPSMEFLLVRYAHNLEIK